MKISLMFSLFMRLMLLALTLGITSCSGGSNPSEGGTSQRDPLKFVKTLELDNFIVQTGSLTTVDILGLVSKGLMPSAYGNNAGATYFTAIIPPSPGQNPSTAPPGQDVFKDQEPPVNYNPADPHNAVANPYVIPVGANYKMRPDEAVVVITRTPPKATYFGYLGYITLTGNKPGKDYSKVYTPGSAEVGMYHRIFGSLGDTVNNRRIKSDGTPNGVPGNPFDSTAVLIFSADQNVNTRVRRALVANGYSSPIINDIVIPSSLVRMGLDKGMDCFNLIGRVAIWENEATGKSYTDNLNQYSSVYRVTPRESSTLKPFPIPAVITEETGRTEEQALPGQETDLNTIRAAILAQYGKPGYSYTELKTRVWIPYGFTCYNLDQDCLADNRDALYLATDNFHFATDDDFVVVYGVNHDSIKTTTYSNLSVYGADLLNGVAGAYSTTSFAHTADSYLPAGRKENYYVYRAARSPAYTGEPCVVIPKSSGNPQGKAFGVDNVDIGTLPNDNMFLAFRYYVNPVTGVAPSLYEVSYDRAIVFNRK